jgi:hypothetical protein
VSARPLFLRLRTALEAAGVPYMLTGSFASSVHGTPRATRDIDLVIAPTREGLLALLDRFPEADYYVSREAALDALARHGQFNVVDHATGWKIDLIIRKAREFSREEFGRRREMDLDGVRLTVASPEDVLVAKLEWARLGSSERQLEDAAGIVRAQGEALDVAYVERWVKALGLEAQWREARARVTPDAGGPG